LLVGTTTGELQEAIRGVGKLWSTVLAHTDAELGQTCQDRYARDFCIFSSETRPANIRETSLCNRSSSLSTGIDSIFTRPGAEEAAAQFAKAAAEMAEEHGCTYPCPWDDYKKK
jgi:hypothetical protein